MRPGPLHAWLLAVLLLAAQAVGLAHRISHAPQTGAVLFRAAAQQLTDPAHDHNHHHEPADGHQAGSADCRLIDQLAHADALCVGDATPGPLLVPHSAALALVMQTVPAGPFAHYLARAPPRA